MMNCMCTVPRSKRKRRASATCVPFEQSLCFGPFPVTEQGAHEARCGWCFCVFLCVLRRWVHVQRASTSQLLAPGQESGMLPAWQPKLYSRCPPQMPSHSAQVPLSYVPEFFSSRCPVDLSTRFIKQCNTCNAGSTWPQPPLYSGV